MMVKVCCSRLLLLLFVFLVSEEVLSSRQITTQSTTIATINDTNIEKEKLLNEQTCENLEEKAKIKHQKKPLSPSNKLHFNGEFSFITENIYFSPVLSSVGNTNNDGTIVDDNISFMNSIFRDTKNRDLLIKGGDNQIEVVEKTPELIEKWKRNKQQWQEQQQQKQPFDHHKMDCDVAITTSDKENEEESMTILAIYSTVPFLPGLSIGAVSYMGCTLSVDKESGLPCYEFTLIEEYYSPKGTRTLSWLFNQIVGEGDRHHIKHGQRYSSSSSRQTYATVYVSLLPLKDDGKKTVNDCAKDVGFRFSFYGNVQVYCELPRRVLQVLPLSKKKIEEKVSESIAKQIQREGEQSFRKFEDRLKIRQHQQERDRNFDVTREKEDRN